VPGSTGLSTRAGARGGPPRSSALGRGGLATHLSITWCLLHLRLARKGDGGFLAVLLTQTAHLRKNIEMLVKEVKQKPETK